MAQYRTRNPYDPRFALPANIMAEPPGRGAMVTAQLPRKTIGSMPRDASYSSGYAVPNYIADEVPGRGAATTRMLPRGWPKSLGDDEASVGAGQQIANWITATISQVPASMRPYALRAALDRVEPGLYNEVVRRSKALTKQGVPTGEATRAAIASATSEGVVKEMVRLGRQAPGAMDGLWDSIKSGVKKAGSWLSHPENAIAALNPLTLQAKLAASPEAQQWAGKAVKEIGKAACAFAKSPAAPAAAGAAGTAFGAPPQAGAIGANIAAQACAGGQPASAAGGGIMSSSWVVPVAIGGAGLVAILLLTR